jgi:hypothetical protein
MNLRQETSLACLTIAIERVNLIDVLEEIRALLFPPFNKSPHLKKWAMYAHKLRPLDFTKNVKFYENLIMSLCLGYIFLLNKDQNTVL